MLVREDAIRQWPKRLGQERPQRRHAATNDGGVGFGSRPVGNDDQVPGAIRRVQQLVKDDGSDNGDETDAVVGVSNTSIAKPS